MPVVYKEKGEESSQEIEKQKEVEDDVLKNIFTTCLKIRLEEILNLPIDDEDTLK